MISTARAAVIFSSVQKNQGIKDNHSQNASDLDIDTNIYFFSQEVLILILAISRYLWQKEKT